LNSTSKRINQTENREQILYFWLLVDFIKTSLDRS